MAPLLSFVVAGDAPDALAGPELAGVEVVRAEPNAALEEATGEYVWFLEAAGRVAAVPDARVTVPAPAAGPAEEIAPAFARVFAFLDAHPEVPAARRRLVLGAMLQHELSRLRRLPAGERAAAFAGLSESWR